jgi:hypothetical protein
MKEMVILSAVIVGKGKRVGDSGRCRSVFRGMPITRSGLIPIS